MRVAPSFFGHLRKHQDELVGIGDGELGRTVRRVVDVDGDLNRILEAGVEIRNIVNPDVERDPATRRSVLERQIFASMLSLAWNMIVISPKRAIPHM